MNALKGLKKLKMDVIGKPHRMDINMHDDKITISKGIGILLMVIAHAGIPDIFSRFIYMFHMPLFFFMSGYCFKEKHSTVTFITKRIKGLYIPFVKYSLLFLLLHNTFYYLNIYNDEYGFGEKTSYLYTWKEYAIRCIRIVLGLHGQEQLLGGYWFLPQLLYASIIGFFTIKYVKNLYTGMAIILGLAIMTSFFELRIPFWGIRSLTFLSTVFFLAGYVYKKKYNNWNKGYLSVLFVIIVAAGSVLCYTSMLSFTTDKILPYTVCAVCGTVMTLNVSQYIDSKGGWIKNLLVYVGNNTLTVLTWHFLCFKIVSLIIIQCHNLPIGQLACFPIIPEYTSWWIAYFVVGTGLPLSILASFRKKPNN